MDLENNEMGKGGLLNVALGWVKSDSGMGWHGRQILYRSLSSQAVELEEPYCAMRLARGCNP